MGLRGAILQKKQAEGTVPDHIRDMIKSGEEVTEDELLARGFGSAILQKKQEQAGAPTIQEDVREGLRSLEAGRIGETLGEGLRDGIMMTLATMDGDKYLSELHDQAVETAEQAEKNALARLCSIANDLTLAKQELLRITEERDSFKLANDNLLDDNYNLQAQLDITERARSDGKLIIEKLVNKGRATSNTIAHYKARIQEQDAEYIALAKENEQNIIKIASLEVQVLSAEKMVEWVQRNEADNCETIDQLYKENQKLKKVLRAIKEMAKC